MASSKSPNKFNLFFKKSKYKFKVSFRVVGKLKLSISPG
jgi:hypothetical protein